MGRIVGLRAKPMVKARNSSCPAAVLAAEVSPERDNSRNKIGTVQRGNIIFPEIITFEGYCRSCKLRKKGIHESRLTTQPGRTNQYKDLVLGEEGYLVFEKESEFCQ